jgi:hypothetical protein
LVISSQPFNGEQVITNLFSGNDSSGQNNWKGAWWHSSFNVHSGDCPFFFLPWFDFQNIVLLPIIVDSHDAKLRKPIALAC